MPLQERPRSPGSFLSRPLGPRAPSSPAFPDGGTGSSSAPCILVCHPHEGRHSDGLLARWPRPAPVHDSHGLVFPAPPRPAMDVACSDLVCPSLSPLLAQLSPPAPALALPQRGRLALQSARSGHRSYRMQSREVVGRALCGQQALRRSLQRAGHPTSVSSSSGPPPDSGRGAGQALLPRRAASRCCPGLTWGCVFCRDTGAPGGILPGAVLSKYECLQRSQRPQSYRVLASQLKQREVGLFTRVRVSRKHILREVLWGVRNSGLPRFWEDCPCGHCGPGFLPFSQEEQRPSCLLFRGSHRANVEHVLLASDENVRCRQVNTMWQAPDARGWWG